MSTAKTYVPVEGVKYTYSGDISSSHYVTAFDNDVFNANPNIQALTVEIDSFRIGFISQTSIALDVRVAGSSTRVSLPSGDISILAEYGITLSSDYKKYADSISLSGVAHQGTFRREVSKIYVPVGTTEKTRRQVVKVYVPVFDDTTQTCKRRLVFDGSSA